MTGASQALSLAVLGAARVASEDQVEVAAVDVSPGVLGFLITFAVVLAAVVLFRSMTSKVRGVQRRGESAGPVDGDADR